MSGEHHRAAGSASLATTLRGYVNRWVAIQRNQVLTDQDSFSDTVAWLRANSLKADAVFLVPTIQSSCLRDSRPDRLGHAGGLGLMASANSARPDERG